MTKAGGCAIVNDNGLIGFYGLADMLIAALLKP